MDKMFRAMLSDALEVGESYGKILLDGKQATVTSQGTQVVMVRYADQDEDDGPMAFINQMTTFYGDRGTLINDTAGTAHMVEVLVSINLTAEIFRRHKPQASFEPVTSPVLDDYRGVLFTICEDLKISKDKLFLLLAKEESERAKDKRPTVIGSTSRLYLPNHPLSADDFMVIMEVVGKDVAARSNL